MRIVRRKKQPQPLDESKIREIFQEELRLYDSLAKQESEALELKSKRQQILKAMSPNKRRQFLRYLKRRKGER